MCGLLVLLECYGLLGAADVILEGGERSHGEVDVVDMLGTLVLGSYDKLIYKLFFNELFMTVQCLVIEFLRKIISDSMHY